MACAMPVASDCSCRSRYLLEKPRVCSHLPHERNYHALYMMLKLEDEERGLQLPSADWKQYAVLFQEHTSPPHALHSWNDAEEMRTVHDALTPDSLGFSQGDRRDLYKILSLVLLLGNVRFGGGREICAGGTELKLAAGHMGVDVDGPNGLVHVLSHRTLKRGEETYQVEANPAAGLASMLMHMYSLAFGWVVSKTNEAFATSQPVARHIGVLDIFGFENFEGANGINSHAQLCINFANESLHHLFIKLALEIEKSIYKAEGFDLGSSLDDDNDNTHILESAPSHAVILRITRVLCGSVRPLLAMQDY